MASAETAARSKATRMPDTYVILFFVVVVAWVATWIIPAGQFQTHPITYDAGGIEKTRTVLAPGTFKVATTDSGDPLRISVPVFAPGGNIGFFNYAFEGLTSGSKWGSSVGGVAFILIVGGAFGIILRTGVLEDGILVVIDRMRGREILFIPVELAPAAMVVGMAKGIMMILGSDDPALPSVLNTLLESAGGLLSGTHAMAAAWFMLLFQSIFNFFIVSGSGQAALTMPLLAPLGDLAGVNRQVTVLAFQLGDGLTNILVPTSASLMGVLGVARIDWTTWLRHIWVVAIGIFTLATIAVLYAVASGLT